MWMVVRTRPSTARNEGSSNRDPHDDGEVEQNAEEKNTEVENCNWAVNRGEGSYI